MKFGASQLYTANINTSRITSTVDGYAPKRNYFVKSAKNMEMIWCPPGGFLMGPGPGEDSPSHPVLLTKGFYLGKYEVTQKQFEKVLRVNASTFRGDNLPVEMVSWNDAVKFCETLKKWNARPGDGSFRFQRRPNGNTRAGRVRPRLIPLASSSHLNLPIMWPVELGVLNRWVPTHPTFLVFMTCVEMLMNGRRTFTGLIRRVRELIRRDRKTGRR